MWDEMAVGEFHWSL